MDRMLGSCAGHRRSWPLTSPLFHWQHQSDSVISVMSSPVYPVTVQFTRCDTVALESLPTVGAGSYFRSPSLITDRFDEKLPFITVVVVYSEQDSEIQKLWKGNFPPPSFPDIVNNATTVQFLGRQTEFIFWFRSFSCFLCLVSRQGKRSVIVFGS